MVRISECLAALGSLLFPASCLLCSQPLPGRPDVLLCPGCLSSVKFIRDPVCLTCGRPFVSNEQPGHRCGTCLTRPYHFDSARAVAFYDGSILHAIHQFKFNRKVVFAETLGRLNSGGPPFDWDRFDVFMPVPLHVERLRKRGFNQALLILRTWTGNDTRKIDFGTLTRPRWTEPQTGLKHTQRRRNIKGAFQVKRPERVRGKSILLCDDVFTTGATVNECARVLKEAGAREVCVLTLARAVAH